jgi:RimJ/RimL family protein N-acetyltransferase
MPDHTTAFEFRPLAETDLAQLRAWLLRPHVAQWWGTAESIEELRTDYLPAVRSANTTHAYIVQTQGVPIGFLQCYVVMGSGGGWWEAETDPGARGIDQFLADPHRLNAGLGRTMLRAFIEQLFADPVVTSVQTDPSPDNARAIRCYTAAGFAPIATVQTPDGPALLMRCQRPPASASSR